MEVCKCGKCGGSGFLSEYRGIRQGKCFACNGTGEYKTSTRTWYQINGHFWIKAKDEATAVKKANEQFKKKGKDVEVNITAVQVR